MHPSLARLVAFCDDELSAPRRRRVASHVAACRRCRDEVQRIRTEISGLSPIAEDTPVDAAPLWSAIADWRQGRATAAPELARRVKSQLELYCGAATIPLINQPDLPAEHLFGKATELFELFLGSQEAEAVRDHLLRGLDWATERHSHG